MTAALLLLSLVPSAPEWVDRVSVEQAVSAKDVVYARRSGHLAMFDDRVWRDIGPGPNAHLESIASDPLGGIVALIRQGTGWEIWRYSRDRGRRLVTLEAPIPGKPRLFATTQGSVWLIGDSRRLVEVSKRGEVKVHVLDPSWLVSPESSQMPACRGLTANGCCEESSSSGQLYCGSVRMFEASGALWFWSKGSSNSYVLPGLLRYDGRFTPWNRPGLPNAVTRAVALDTPESALLSAHGALWRVNLRSQTASPEPFPPLVEQTPQNILALHRGPRSTLALAERAFQQEAGILFQRRGTGFERRLEGVGGTIYPFMEDPIFASAIAPDGAEHLWMATPEGPIWHLSAAAPERLDWSREVPLTHVTGIFLVGANRLLVTDSSAGSLLLSPWNDAPPPSTIVTRMPFMKKALTWTPDRRLWWLEEKDPIAIHEWNGEKSLSHSPPPGSTENVYASNSTLFADSKGRLWIVPTPSSGYPDEGPPVLGMDTRTSAWTQSSSYVEAVRKVSGSGISSVSSWDVESLPALLDGTWCISDPKRSVSCVFPGRAWKRWSPDEISGQSGSNLWSVPFIENGRIHVLVNHRGRNTRWAWSGSWKQEPESSPASAVLAPPTRCTSTSPVILGEDGRLWFSDQDRLMVARGEVCRPRMEGVMPQGVSLARFDARMHDLLLSGSELLVLMDDTLFPETKLGSPRVSLDSVQILVKGATLVEYRVDTGPWHAMDLGSQGSLVIEGFAKGSHRVDVRSGDAHWRVDPTPETVRFEIKQVPGRTTPSSSEDVSRTRSR